jgi:hypothetical protein
MRAKSALAITNEERAVGRRARLRVALKAAGTNPKAASLKAGLGATYIHDFLHGKSHSNDLALKAICDGIGIRWEWLDGKISESAPILKSQVVTLPSAIETTKLLLESVLGYFAPDRLPNELQACASLLLSILLEVAQDPQMRELKNDERQRDRVRGIIEGALRATFR